MSKDEIYFILVRTQFAANLGSAARALKNMGFEKLILVQPQCEVGVEARSRAMKGAGILDGAQLFPSLEKAAEGLQLLVGTAGRFGPEKASVLSSRMLAEELLPRYGGCRVGIVFGSEDNGLRRSEVRLCQWLVEIPTQPECPSINLAQAVAILAYELHLSISRPSQPSPLAAAPADEIQALVEHARQVLESLGFPRRISVPRLMKRMERIAGRAQLQPQDLNMLHGLLTEIGKLARSPSPRQR